MTIGSRLGLTLLLLAGCGAPPPPGVADPAPSPAPAPATRPAREPQLPAIAPLRTGTRAAEVGPRVELEAIERGVVGDHELVRAILPRAALGREPGFGEMRRSVISVDGVIGCGGVVEEVLPVAPAGSRDEPLAGPPSYELWLRRPASRAGQPLEARIHRDAGAYPTGLVIPVTVDVGGAQAAPKLEERWRRAVGAHLAARELPFSHFAGQRLGAKNATPPGRVHPDAPAQEWAYLMDLSTGATSVRAALQERARLASAIDRFRPSLPFSVLQPPRTQRHPWKQMLAALGRQPPAEPLAEVAPASFYFVRANDVGALFAVLDEIDAWVTPLVHLMEARSEHRRLSARYRTLLGLPGSELSRVLGPTVIRRLALVGSDPFLRQGSDVTVIAEVGNATLLGAGLERELASALAGRGEPSRATVDHRGVPIRIVRSADGAVAQHRASVGGFELISNSRAAVERVLDTIAGRAPALSRELDFQYMLARDPGTSQVLAYAGDRFIDNAVGPRSRILDARRQVALSELERPAFAALLYGWLMGREPANAKTLLASKLLVPDDLRHFDGAPIGFEPGAAPRSRWGTPAFLTPILDLPDPERITEVERQAYRSFTNLYESFWSDRLDPIALRVDVEPAERRLNAKLRVLPLVRDRDYRNVMELVGDSRLIPGRIRDGARLVFAIAPESTLRRELTESSRSFLGSGLKLDWVGDYGMLGTLDRPELANALHRAGLAPELRDPDAKVDEAAALMELPLYAAIAVKQRTAAALMLTYLRGRFADEVDFSNHGEHRGTTIVRVRADRDVAFYYALSDHALYLALQPWVIEHLLDEEQAGGLPTQPGPREASAGQASFEAKAAPEGGLVTALRWLIEKGAGWQGAQRAAEMLLVGAPSTRADPERFAALGLAYLGSVPFTVDGRPFELRPSGAADPLRGNDFERSYPALPVAGSPAAAVLGALALFRTQIAYDREPVPDGAEEERSLSVEVTVGRR